MFTTPPPYQSFSPFSINESNPLIPIIFISSSIGIFLVGCGLTYACMNILPRRNQLPSTDDVANADIVFANNEQNNNDLIVLSRDSLIGRVFGGSAGRDIRIIIASNTSEPSNHLVRPAPFIPPDSQILTGVVVESLGVNFSTIPR